MHSFTGTVPIIVKSLDGINHTSLDSAVGDIVLEFTMKPFRDRLSMTGWTTITDGISWIVEDGFQLQFPTKQWRRFKTEAYFPRVSSKKVQVGLLRAIREEDWYMDQENLTPHKGTFERYLDKVFGEIPHKVTPGLAQTNIIVSPAKGATLRQIFYDLSIKHDFLWTLLPDHGVTFFRQNEPPDELRETPIQINIARARRTPTGWQIADDQGYQAVYPGTVLDFSRHQHENARLACVVVWSRLGAKSFMDYTFIKQDISPVKYETIRSTLDSRKVSFIEEREDGVPYPGVNFVSMEQAPEAGFFDGLLTGVYARTDRARLKDSGEITGAGLHRVEDLSPWATTKGYGMVFPRYRGNPPIESEEIGKSLSVTLSLSRTTSARVGDVPYNVWNKNGRAFHLRFPEGFLYHELDNELGPKLYSFFPPGPKKDELIAEADKYRGSAWKMKASSGIILTVGEEEKKPSTVPMDEDETFLALLRGGQSFLSVAGKDGPFGFIASNLDDSLGGGGSTVMHAGLDHSISIELEPDGESRISMSAKDLIADIERESHTKAEKSSFDVDTFDVFANKIYFTGDETYIHGGVGVNKRTITIKDGVVNIT